MFIGYTGPESGYGKLKYKNGDVEEGKWTNNEFMGRR